MRVIDLRAADTSGLDSLLPRPEIDIAAALKTVQPIIEDVRDRGAVALYEYAEKFDGVRPVHLRVPEDVLQRTLDEQASVLTAALEVSIANTRISHESQLPTDLVTEVVPGGFVYQRWVPLTRVGLYVPGGLAVYPSSVVMNVVAAQVAGVDSLVVASPPQKEFGGLPHPTILAACAMLGVKEVIAVGGAQAIAAMAYGFSEEMPDGGTYYCERVDMVTGPGNIYVAAAKRQVQQVCGIDSEAGTTEIAVLADQGANPEYIAADLISQAEHDPAAASILVTDSEALIERVQAALELQVQTAHHSERIAKALSGPQSGIVLARDIEQATRIVERYGAEHLEVVTKDALERSLRIKNAGAIFVGDYSPVPLGDYVAGSNHVLPTGGTARYSSGLNTTTYLRSVQVIDYSEQALDSVRGPLVTLARAEGLPSHGTAADIRFKDVAGGLPEASQSVVLPVRDDLRSVQPYGAPQLDVPVRLNVNENPHPPSDRVVDAISNAVRAASSRLNRYADRDAIELRDALAEYLHRESGMRFARDRIWAANGSNEVMIQLLQAFGGPGRTALAQWPTYSMYEEYARDTNTNWCLVGEGGEFRIEGDGTGDISTADSADDTSPHSGLGTGIDSLIDAMRRERPAVVFIPSPNNPSGVAVDRNDLQRVLDAARTTGPVRRAESKTGRISGTVTYTAPTPSDGPRATIVIVDEAYGEFRDPGQNSALELLADNPHMVVTRTMSKAFAAAGLRVGYMVASPRIVDEVLKVRLPYHLSSLTQAAALAALGQAEAQLAQVESIRQRRGAVAESLRRMGLGVAASSSNFLLFGPLEDRRRVWEGLLERGVLIREVGPAGYLRVTVGTDEENELFLRALEESL